MVWGVMPSHARLETYPLVMMSLTMENTSFMGMAKPRPSTASPLEEEAYLAETMPTTSPYWLKRGPPEFPGLMEVSV